jgi:hypothetical protein
MRTFENKLLTIMFGLKREEQEDGENYVMRSFIIRVLHQILFGW